MTIIYESDWDKYPNAIPHHNTKNKGFIRLAAIYRNMGVKNYQMILALHNPALDGVDYFDESLPIAVRAMIVLEAKENYWFYVRELVRAPGLAGRDPVMFRPNRAMIAMYWLYLNHVMPIVVIGRQQGKSFGLDVLTEWLVSIRSKDSLINMLTKDRVLRAASIKRLKEIDKLLPTYISRQTRLDANNTEEFTVKALNNQYLVHLPQRSKKAAINLGRGLTSKDTFIDEGPFQSNISLSLPAAAAASTAARVAAEESGTPYGMVMITTAASKDDPDGRYIFGLLTDAAPWVETYYNCLNMKELHHVVRTNSAKNLLHVNCTFSHRQLGYTDDQLNKWIEDALVTEDEANRDFRNMWTSGSDNHVLSKTVLAAINDSKSDPTNTKIYHEGYVIKWYVSDPEKYLDTHDVVYGLDPSDAIGSDNIAMVILDAVTGAVIGVGSFNETNITVFSKWLLQLHLDNPKLVGIIERKSTGVGIIDFLIQGLHKHGVNPYTRLYNTIVQRVGELETQWESLQHYNYNDTTIADRNRKYIGYVTSGTGINSRNMLYVDVFKVAMETCKTTIHDNALITEILGLTVKNGRLDHGPNSHDDLVVAFLLASYLLYKGNRLEYYKINPATVLTKTKARVKLPPRQAQQQREYRQRIVELLSKLKNNDSPMLDARYERELRLIDSKLILSSNESFNISQAIQLVTAHKEVKPQPIISRVYGGTMDKFR